MRAAVAHDRSALRVEERPLPEPGPGQVRIRVEACGICGTDLHLRQVGYAPGHTPGHEIAGRVDARGDGVASPGIGRRVAVGPLRSCGHCASCRAGRDSVCPSLQVHGVHIPGGFAEHVVVDAHRAFPVPEDVPPALAALAEPVAVAVHGIRRGGVTGGERVLVLGAGTVGLLATLAAQHAGAAEIWVTARHAHQAALARRLGATRVLSEAESDLAALQRLGREEPADVVVETIGGDAVEPLRAAAWALAPGGTISVLGLFTAPISLDGLPLLMKEGSLVWSNCYGRTGESSDFADAIALLSAERDRLQRLLTRTLPLDEIETAFGLAADKRAGAVKITVGADAA